VVKITWDGDWGWREESCVCKSALKEGGTFQVNIHYTASHRATFSTKANHWSGKRMFIFIFSCRIQSFLVTVELAWGGWGHVTLLLRSLPYPKWPSFDAVLCFAMVFSERSTTVYQLRRGLVPNYAERGAPPGSYAEAILWPTTWGTEGTLEIFSSFSYLPTVSTWGTEGTLEILVVSLTCVQWQPVYCSFLIENAYSSYM